MVTHKVYRGGADGLYERLKELSSQIVAVGIPADKNEEGRNKNGKDDITNSDLAYIHTHGIRSAPMRAEMQPEINKGTEYSSALQMYLHEHGSASYQSPPRPIIEPAIEGAKAGIAKRLEKAARAALDGGDVKKDLTNVGQYAENKVKRRFTDNDWAPNAPSTIARKGSDRPLIDSGALRKSITFVIRGGGND